MKKLLIVLLLFCVQSLSCDDAEEITNLAEKMCSQLQTSLSLYDDAGLKVEDHILDYLKIRLE